MSLRCVHLCWEQRRRGEGRATARWISLVVGVSVVSLLLGSPFLSLSPSRSAPTPPTPLRLLRVLPGERCSLWTRRGASAMRSGGRCPMPSTCSTTAWPRFSAARCATWPRARASTRTPSRSTPLQTTFGEVRLEEWREEERGREGRKEGERNKGLREREVKSQAQEKGRGRIDGERIARAATVRGLCGRWKRKKGARITDRKRARVTETAQTKEPQRRQRQTAQTRRIEKATKGRSGKKAEGRAVDGTRWREKGV